MSHIKEIKKEFGNAYAAKGFKTILDNPDKYINFVSRVK